MAGLYVYGFTTASGPRLRLPEGIGAAPVSAYRFGALAALVSPVDPDAFVGRARDVKAHEAVLRTVRGQRESVLPLRFGTVLDGTDALENELLAPGAARLEALLGELAGTAEFQLRALYPDAEALLRTLVDSDPGLARLRARARRSGSYMSQLELGEATVAAFERRRAADTAMLRDRLAPHARETTERHELPERVAAQLSFLVERDRASAFEQEAERVAADTHGRFVLRLVGPLPPYSFVAYELEPAGAA